MARGYIFESSKPESVKRREAAAKKQKRSAAAKKAAATREAAKAAPMPPDLTAKQIRQRINYINRRIRLYGDPDNAVRLLSDALRTDAGMIAKTPEAIQFFAERQWMLGKIQSQIKKHPVSNAIRDAFEEMLSSIYDQMQEIGSEEFYRITGKNMRDAVQNDVDSDAKMLDAIQKWREGRQKLAAYYDEQIRGGKLTPYTD